MVVGSLLKWKRLRQTAGEGYTRCRKFEWCSGLEDGASQNWWQVRQTQQDDRQFLVVGFWRFQKAPSKRTSFFSNSFQEISNVVHRLRAGSQVEQHKNSEMACSVYVRVAAEAYSRLSSRTFFDGPDVEEKSCVRL